MNMAGKNILKYMVLLSIKINYSYFENDCNRKKATLLFQHAMC